jgi:hypothetical protein
MPIAKIQLWNSKKPLDSVYSVSDIDKMKQICCMRLQSQSIKLTGVGSLIGIQISPIVCSELAIILNKQNNLCEPTTGPHLLSPSKLKIKSKSASIKKLDSLLNFTSFLADDIKDKRKQLSLCYQVYPID